MLVVSSPQALPGSCYFCGSASRKAYIDTLVQVEFHGAMYICDICLYDMLNLLGGLSEEQATELRNALEFVQTELQNKNKEIEGLKRAVDGLTTARRYSGLDTDVPSLSNPVSIPEIVQGNTDGESESESRVATDSGGVAEQNSNEQLDRVRKSSGDDGSSESDFKLAGL